MEQATQWFNFVTSHPSVAVAVGAALILTVYLLARKPRHVRAAEDRLRELRDERAGQYDRMRSPR